MFIGDDVVAACGGRGGVVWWGGSGPGELLSWPLALVACLIRLRLGLLP